MKYLIYKGTGGLVHMLNGIQEALELSKKENRFLIIDTEQLTAFKKNFSNYFFIWDKNIKYSTDYNSMNLDLEFNDMKISDIIKKKAQFREGKYYLENTEICIQKHHSGNENDQIRIWAGHSELFIQNIRLKNNILYNIFDSTISVIEKYNKYISVHFRNTDMKNSIKDFIIKIQNISHKFNIKNIFIATDDSKAFNIFQNFLPDLNFFKINDIQDCYGKNIHYHYKDKDLQIMGILKDIYMIVNSKYFIPSINSGVSKWIVFQKNNTDHRIFDDNYDFEIV
jgi:hypothetical protein